MTKGKLIKDKNKDRNKITTKNQMKQAKENNI